MNRSEFVGVLQARMGSSRLPGKMAMTVCGQPILALMLRRMQAAQKVSHWVFATTAAPRDEALVRIAADVGVESFRGSEDDVLDRLYGCARSAGISCMVRVGGDNPLLDPRVIDATVEAYAARAGEFDYFSNHHPPTFPDGQEVEIIPFRALEIAWREARHPHEREHGTPFLWDQPQRFRIGNYAHAGENLYSDNRWTLDFPEDFALIRAVMEELHPANPNFSMEDVLALMRRRPDIPNLNAMHRGKTWQLNVRDRIATVGQYDKARRA